MRRQSFFRSLNDFHRENPFLFVIGLLIVGNLVVVFFFFPGQTLWAFLASSELSLNGYSSTGTVQETDFNEVQSGISKFEGVYTTTISHNGRTRIFHTPKQIAKDGESVPLIVLSNAPNVFVPMLDKQGYWERLQLLADISIVKGIQYIIIFLLLSVFVLGSVSFGVGWFAIRRILPWLRNFCIRQDQRLISLRSQIARFLDQLRNILFVLLYIALLAIVFLEISRSYLEIALNAERYTALATVGFLCVGIPFILAIFFLLRSIRRKELLPNLQSTLAIVLAVIALSRVVNSAAQGLYSSLIEGKTNITPLLHEIFKQLTGF